MASYVIVGASRGLGFEFVRQLSANPANTVIGLVRDVTSVKAKVETQLGRSNVHLLRYDLNDHTTIPEVVDAASKILQGKLDYLIANGGVGGGNASLKISEIKPQDLEDDFVKTFRTNVVGTAQIIGAFMPLILKGATKKVFAITSGMGDPGFARENDIWMGASYCTSKSALNMVVAKFSAEFREQGILVMGISPGVVDTGFTPPGKEEDDVGMKLGEKVMAYEPTWKGPIQPEDSVKHMLSVMEKSKIDDGNAGAMISHLGNKRWV